jgi:hypothetical protein
MWWAETINVGSSLKNGEAQGLSLSKLTKSGTDY